MGDSALCGDDREVPEWAEIKRLVMRRAEACADAVFGLLLRPRDPGAVSAVEEAAAAFRDALGCLRTPVIDERVISAERARAADEALAAYGLVPPQRGRHLHVVS